MKPRILVIDTGRSIAAVAREIGVGEQLLGRWVAVEPSRMDDPPAAIDADERAELERLRREVAELRMDREFLKKSSGLLRHGELEPVQAFAVIDAEKATTKMTVESPSPRRVATPAHASCSNDARTTATAAWKQCAC